MSAMNRAHRPLVVTRNDRILLDGRQSDQAGLRRLEALIREGKTFEAAMETVDQERVDARRAQR